MKLLLLLKSPVMQPWHATLVISAVLIAVSALHECYIECYPLRLI